MDWKRAIEINRGALAGVLAGLAGVLAVFEGALRLPRRVHRSLTLDLFKTESAVRRLIVMVMQEMAARGFVAALPPPRPMPAGLVIASRQPGHPSRRAFPLFDARVAYRFEEDAAPAAVAVTGPRIRVIDAASPREQFLSRFTPPTDTLCSVAEAHVLRLRLAAATRALHNLISEAKRMARWQARRARMETPAFLSPLRPGPPPGNNSRAKQEIDLILRECHALARHFSAKTALARQGPSLNSS
jgi:hypothetical protein